MRLLDLFCGAGGAAMGYYRAGFTEIIGIDNRPQKRYPFKFVLGDALEYMARYGHKFDLIHASPPCQAYSITASLSNGNHSDLVEPVRMYLQAISRPYIIENVPGAPLINPIKLCGTMFPGLRVIRHRLFECSPTVWFPPGPCQHWGKVAPNFGKGTYDKSEYDFICAAGKGFPPKVGREAMGIDWMTGKELSQAIPPPYTEWLGGQMIKEIR